MRRKLTWSLLAVVVAGAGAGTRALATPASGFSASTLAMARFDQLSVRNASNSDHWRATLKTKGLSDVYVQSNLWTPGGTTGWHTHPGHSLIIVTAGTITAYHGDDPTCTPQVYTQGMGFVDEGGDHVHVLRNEGDTDARTVAVQMIPAAAVRRIDAPSPGNCSF
jgi:uncharacterized cupin superfamily protein